MVFELDRDALVEDFRRLVEVPSPVGYDRELKPVLEKMAEELGHSLRYDNKGTAYLTLEGKDNSKTVMIGAHVDTLGLTVRGLEASGLLRVSRLGGGCVPSLEGESVTVHTRDGRRYTGLVICRSHSVHVFDDAHTLERNESNIRVLLDEDVSSKEELVALGIRNGDVISIDPHFELTEGGYIKSRFIDDKGCVACCFAALRWLKENGARPRYKTVFAFPYYEEIGLGGVFVPEGVSEYVAVDIGLIGPELDGNERSVSICAKDARFPYDYALTSRLIEYAERAGCRYAVDVYPRYSSDAHAAVSGGNDLRAAVFGMGVYCTHGRERSHVEGFENTARLLLAYVLGL
ncbi:MAG: M42 family metallopeptidase [Clostridia bacterium]|nr:M42 family metallopeptidase [Clostridia bacterium]